MDPILEIDHLSVLYGKPPAQYRALSDVSLSVAPGEIVGFLGPNGAGKTTTIKTLLGLISPSAGRVTVVNLPPSSLTARAAIGFMPEIANYYGYVTPRELLSFYGRLFGIPGRVLSERISALLELAGIAEAQNKLMQTFSKGMLQKVSFAQALINEPKLLILDEPTTGLDPLARMNMRDTLLTLKDRGTTIFFSSHELSEVEMICDRVAILKNGVLLKQASPRNMLNEKGEHITLERYFLDLIKNDA